MNLIHPTAIIDPHAELDSSVQVGPYAVIDGGVKMGPECVIGPHVHLTGLTTMGSHNKLHAGVVLGDAPQDLKYQGEPTRLLIGDHNVFREHVTIHRSNNPETETIIGSHNMLMANSHVGHNSELGDQVIVANGALLGGHVLVQDQAFISGNCMLHQFVRVGTLSIMQGGSGIGLDLPPFVVARGNNGMCGLNTIGLRRAGLSPDERLELKKLYHALFRSRQKLRDVLPAARAEFPSPSCQVLLDFVASSKRGIVRDTGRDGPLGRPGAGRVGGLP